VPGAAAEGCTAIDGSGWYVAPVSTVGGHLMLEATSVAGTMELLDCGSDGMVG